jgi:hypothetical protein
MTQKTYIARKGEDADFKDLTVDSLVVNDVTIDAGAITLADGKKITLGDGADITINWDSAKLELEGAAASSPFSSGAAGHVLDITHHGTLTVGVDGTGYDVKFFSDTAGCSLLWDESEDQLVITGPADTPALKIAGAGSKSPAAYAAAGTAWADGGTPEFAADQMYLMLDIGGTVYRIPLWANA